jgi:integrase
VPPTARSARDSPPAGVTPSSSLTSSRWIGRQGSFVDPRLGKITVEEWFERWWPTVTSLRPTTRARDEASFRNHVLPTFGSTALPRVDRTSLREGVARMSDPVGDGLAPATTSKAVQVFNKAMRAALEDRLISVNPVERLPLPKIEREEMRFLTPTDLALLADTIDPRYRAFVMLAGYSGLRVGELFALRWDNVDMLRRQVTVTETLTDLAGQLSFGPPKTRASPRAVTVPTFVTEELSCTVDSVPDVRTLVFTSPDGHPVRPTLFRRRFLEPRRERGRARADANSRPGPHRRCALDRGRCQPEADRSEGRSHERVRRPRPLRSSSS